MTTVLVSHWRSEAKRFRQIKKFQAFSKKSMQTCKFLANFQKFINSEMFDHN